MKRFSLLLLAAATSFACGGARPATADNNQGTGTTTLAVNASVQGSSSDGGTMTNFRADVSDGAGNPISGATVTLSNPNLGTVTLVEATAGTGRYVNSATSFPNGDYTLNVTRGSDKVQGATVGNPGASTIKAPTVNATVTANQPLAITWTVPMQAQGASIQTRDIRDPILVPDTGSYTLPASLNVPDLRQRLTLVRSNSVELAGALPGSTFDISYEAQVDPFVVQ